MRSDSPSNAPGGPGARRQRALVFSVLLLLVFVVLVAMLERHGVDPQAIDARYLTTRIRTHTAELGWMLALALVSAGTGVGLLGGALGMGGGILKVAGLLLLFGYDIFFARAVSVATMFLMAVSAVMARRGDRSHKATKITRPMMAAALAGVVVGALAGNALRGATLTHLFGFFVLFLGFSALGQLLADPDEIETKRAAGVRVRRRPTPVAATIGALHGFFCGLLGITGGVVSVPMQQTLLLVPVRRAISNSLLVTAVCAGAASVIIVSAGALRGDFDWTLFLSVVLCLGAGAAAGAQLAARLRGRIYASILRVLAVALCVVSSLSILL